jgi:hypothetical protein
VYVGLVVNKQSKLATVLYFMFERLQQTNTRPVVTSLIPQMALHGPLRFILSDDASSLGTFCVILRFIRSNNWERSTLSMEKDPEILFCPPPMIGTHELMETCMNANYRAFVSRFSSSIPLGAISNGAVHVLTQGRIFSFQVAHQHSNKDQELAFLAPHVLGIARKLEKVWSQRRR